MEIKGQNKIFNIFTILSHYSMDKNILFSTIKTSFLVLNCSSLLAYHLDMVKTKILVYMSQN